MLLVNNYSQEQQDLTATAQIPRKRQPAQKEEEENVPHTRRKQGEISKPDKQQTKSKPVEDEWELVGVETTWSVKGVILTSDQVEKYINDTFDENGKNGIKTCVEFRNYNKPFSLSTTNKENAINFVRFIKHLDDNLFINRDGFDYKKEFENWKAKGMPKDMSPTHVPKRHGNPFSQQKGLDQQLSNQSNKQTQKYQPSH